MGDNRDNSSDSRYWGFVPLNLVRGRAMVVWWSHGEPEGHSLRALRSPDRVIGIARASLVRTEDDA